MRRHSRRRSAPSTRARATPITPARASGTTASSTPPIPASCSASASPPRSTRRSPRPGSAFSGCEKASPIFRRLTGARTMRHAGPEAIATLGDLLAAIRARGVKEPRPGIFYRKGKAWLHFHEDAAGLFADLRVSGAWERLRVSEPEEQASLLALLETGPEGSGSLPAS